LKWMSLTLVPGVFVASVVAVLAVKPLLLDCSGVMVGCIQKLSLMLKNVLCKALIRGKVSLNSVIHSDGWRGYQSLVDVGYAKHYRVEHGCNEFANDVSHINGIESFWAYARLRLSKAKGIRKEMFYLYLKDNGI